MIQILLHSSKTMTSHSPHKPLATPLFVDEAGRLAKKWQKASSATMKASMHISDAKTVQVKQLYSNWSLDLEKQAPAIDAFRGDIYSGLQVPRWSLDDRQYAHEHLVILSGLYGALRACDGIMPYRLEMAYKLPDGESMYEFWGDKLGRSIRPEANCIINLSAVEYTKALLLYVKQPVITPKFMTKNTKTGKPEFVVVHAKIARGAFARWLIQCRIEDRRDITKFTSLGYKYDQSLSAPEQPVFVCDTFQGIGLSVRLQ